MPVYGTTGYAGCLGNIVERGRGNATYGKLTDGGINDLLSGILGLLFGFSCHGVVFLKYQDLHALMNVCTITCAFL